MSAAKGQLAIYLNDHLVGATGGVELARRLARAHRSGGRGPILDRLASEIAEDRESLLRLMEQVGVRGDPLKAVAGWVGEKLGRLKLNGHLFTRAPLSTVIELEGMRLGVEGKAAGWRTLRTVAERHGLDRAQLDALLARADKQIETLETLRVEAVETIFGG